jgi:hypothetical protein
MVPLIGNVIGKMAMAGQDPPYAKEKNGPFGPLFFMR